MAGYIDLHTHSTASDGALTPRELVRHAAERGLEAIALTDHDSVSGVEEAQKAGGEFGVRVISGVEFSASFEGEMHFLGLNINIKAPALKGALSRLTQSRDERNKKIIKKLNELGYKIDYSDVLSESAGGTVGRVHIASALVRKGYAGEINAAFKTLLVRGRPAFVEREKLYPKEIIEIIRAAGGVAVLAHPVFLGISYDELESLLPELIGYGLGGMECIYPEHDEEMTRRYIEIAKRHGLYVTGGSDFHGDNKPHIRLGMAGGQPISAALLNEIKL